MSSPKATVLFLNKSNIVIAAREYDPSTNAYSDVFEYATDLMPKLFGCPVKFRVEVTVPSPVERAYETYRQHIARTRAGRSNAFRPEWDKLTTEVKEAFELAMQEYVKAGGNY